MYAENILEEFADKVNTIAALVVLTLSVTVSSIFIMMDTANDDFVQMVLRSDNSKARALGNHHRACFELQGRN